VCQKSFPYYLNGPLPAVNSSLPDDGHPVLEAVDAVGNLGEVVLAERLLLAIERAVVSASA